MPQSFDQVDGAINALAQKVEELVDQGSLDDAPVSGDIENKSKEEGSEEEGKGKAEGEGGKKETETGDPAKGAAGDSGKFTIKWGGSEIEIGKDDLIKFAQQGYDYTRKTQDLAERERMIAPYEGLFRNIQTDPQFASYLAQYFHNKQATPQKPHFDDPLAEMRWDVKQEVLKEVNDLLGKILAPVVQNQAVQGVRSQAVADPYYRETVAAMQKHLETLPPVTKAAVFQNWDTNPQAFMDAYRHYRQGVVAHAEKNKQTPPLNPNPNPGKSVKKAPVLEAAGAHNQTSGDAEKLAKLKKQKTAALRSGDTDAIAAWLEATGMLDNI